MVEAPTDRRHLLGALGRFDEQDVGPRLGEGVGPAQRLVQTVVGTGISAGDDQEIGAVPGFRRDLELNERVLRYMMLAVDEVPEEERKLAAEEDGAEYTVPEPPDDDMIEMPEEEEADSSTDVDIPADIPAEASATAPEPAKEG